ncbi:MAG: hypothetical protein ABL921_33010 [Pirellula sp.]
MNAGLNADLSAGAVARPVAERPGYNGEMMGTNSIDRALEDLAAIRSSLDGAETFRGYRSATVFATAVFAFVGCYLQHRWIDAQAARLDLFLVIWVQVALVSLAVTFGEIVVRYWQSGPVLRRLTRSATAPMIPSLVAGVLLTTAIVQSVPQSSWMLPGLWSILFGLGVFASARYLPSSIHVAAVYYVAAGAVCIGLGPMGSRMAPWTMGLTFGVGQLISSGILYCSLERNK